MKKILLLPLLCACVTLMAACGAQGKPQEQAAPETKTEAPAEEKQPEVKEEKKEEPKEEKPQEQTETPEEAPEELDENEEYGYSDFVQEQAEKYEFASFDEILSYLKPGQGYAYIQVEGAEGDVLALAEEVYDNKGASNVALYAMVDGKPVDLGYVMGYGAEYPVRCADGIVYGGDDLTYEAMFINPETHGVMAKDYVYQSLDANGPTYGGFLRETPDFDHDKDFTGGEAEFKAYLDERDKKKIIEFTVVEGNGEAQAGEHVMTTDMENCDTFTQIVDKLPKGAGYANVKLGDTDVLLVASGTYDNLDGNMAAIDAEIFMYKDTIPTYLGYVECGGTANPLAIKDGCIYSSGHHFVNKSTVTDDKLVTVEEVWENFDTSGNATYTYDSDDGGDYSKVDAEPIFEELLGELEKAEVVNFFVIK